MTLASRTHRANQGNLCQRARLQPSLYVRPKPSDCARARSTELDRRRELSVTDTAPKSGTRDTQYRQHICRAENRRVVIKDRWCQCVGIESTGHLHIPNLCVEPTLCQAVPSRKMQEIYDYCGYCITPINTLSHPFTLLHNYPHSYTLLHTCLAESRFLRQPFLDSTWLALRVGDPASMSSYLRDRRSRIALSFSSARG